MQIYKIISHYRGGQNSKLSAMRQELNPPNYNKWIAVSEKITVLNIRRQLNKPFICFTMIHCCFSTKQSQLCSVEYHQD